MKTASRIFMFTLATGIPLSGALFAADSSRDATGRISVVFAEPEKFTDVRENEMDSDNERGGEHYLPLLRKHIEEAGERLLPAGQRLTITFTDIDLAGEFEPWRGPQLMDVRIVKAIYVPRMTLHFSLTDENGDVLKEGERKLVDFAFQMRATSGFRNDPLRYEKDMLRDWLREEFAPRKG